MRADRRRRSRFDGSDITRARRHARCVPFRPTHADGVPGLSRRLAEPAPGVSGDLLAELCFLALHAGADGRRGAADRRNRPSARAGAVWSGCPGRRLAPATRTRFSGGHRECINIARALALSGRGWWWRDESGSALDVSIQAQIRQPFADLQDRAGPHDACSSPTTSAWCDRSAHRVAVMVPGQDRRELPTADGLYESPLHPYTTCLAVGESRSPTRASSFGRERITLGGRCAQPDRPALGLPVPHPLRLGHRRVSHRGSRALTAHGDGHVVACHHPRTG